jgi:hypothetical protein
LARRAEDSAPYLAAGNDLEQSLYFQQTEPLPTAAIDEKRPL